MKKDIEQPTFDLQRMTSEIMEQEAETVELRGKKHRIGWLKNRTVRKFSHIMLKETDPVKRNVKAAACILLNHRNGLLTAFLLNLWYHIYWRWLYYIVDIDQVEVVAILDASKKKIQSDPLVVATILATGMMDTAMMMARHELGPAARGGVQPTP